jgi:hypothetical protein
VHAHLRAVAIEDVDQSVTTRRGEEVAVGLPREEHAAPAMEAVVYSKETPHRPRYSNKRALLKK